MKEQARFLEWMRQVNEHALRLDALGVELHAMGDVDVFLSFDDLTADVARLETRDPLPTFALRG
jgi:hypothetical protein